ncbi:hypothetical protein [Pseudorhodoplanes sinuspersici]|nr:hypothetical protein [Pseudorhodoplanes sinuspersici]
MNASEARSFVVGKLFTYTCFEGTRGAGRINANGSVGGTIQFRGNGATRYAVLPQNTIRVVGEKVCASVRGMPFEPCFNLIKTSANSFRGSVNGLGFAYCDFVRRDRPVIASTEAQQQLRSRTRTPARVDADDAPAKPDTVAAPTTPVEKKELPKGNDAASSDEKPELRSTTR